MAEILWWAGFWLSMMMIVRGSTLLRHRDDKLKSLGYAFAALGFAGQTVLAVVDHNSFGAVWNSAFLAWCLYGWWNGGGGDGLKRRLKKLSSYFGLGPRLAGQPA